MEDEPLLASDQLYQIDMWVEGMKAVLEGESISYGELSQIEQVYNIIKEQ